MKFAKRGCRDYTECGRKTWRFLSPVILAIIRSGLMQPRSVVSWFHAISVAMEQWTTQHRAFTIEAYFKNCNSAVTTQRLLCRHFNIRLGRVPCRNTINEWVQNFRENASALKGVGSHLLEFLTLTSLKTTKMQSLLWHPNAMWQCYATSVNQSYVVVGLNSHQYGFSKMQQQHTQQGHQWVFCKKCFHNTSFPVTAMFHGRHVCLISPPVITFYGGISKAEFSSLSLEP